MRPDDEDAGLAKDPTKLLQIFGNFVEVPLRTGLGGDLACLFQQAGAGICRFQSGGIAIDRSDNHRFERIPFVIRVELQSVPLIL